MPVEIPLPVTYNPYKHHFRFLQNSINKWRTLPWQTVEQELLSIGSNLIDFYLGALTVEEVVHETITFFKASGIANRDEFMQWLHPHQWKKIVLSDGSEWLIKAGNEKERYVHIHPAKYSAHTIRVRAVTLKTVLALEVERIQIQEIPQQNLEAVNHIRKKLLDLSPVKSLRKSESGILRLWHIFQAPNNYP